MKISEHVHRAVRNSGLTQDEVAEKSGVKQSSVSDFLRKGTCNSRTLDALAKLFRIKVVNSMNQRAAKEKSRLIAAAPDLLEALIYMRRTMYSNESEESIKADAAIAKALGT